ncbi:MAG: sulfatase-like hydrolase/transferase, partial [Opitutales bacterium]
DCWVPGGPGSDAYLEKLDGFETDALTDRFIRFMGRQTAYRPDQPFFAALSVQPPHWPEQAPPAFTKLRADEVQLRPNCAQGSRAEATAQTRAPGYYGLIENWDHNIGRVVQALRRLGISQDTHIVYFADHGEMLGSHGHMGKVLPYEESIRIPCVIGGADHFYQGSRRDAVTAPLMNHVDFAPTSLGLAGIAVPEWMEGTDYSHLRLGGEPSGAIPDSAYIQAIEPREGSPAYRALVTNDGWKYAATDDGAWCLFDLNDDPFEQHNLARIPSARKQQQALHDRLLQWARDLDDPWPPPRE